jgi:hypothetical protein
MTKFVISSEVPETLSNYEIRIDPPNMLQEVMNCWNNRPANGHLGTHWLRQIANEITKWDKSFNPYRNIIPSDYNGVPFSTPEEVADHCLRMVNDTYKGFTDAWVEHCIKNKPPFTKLIWFTGNFKQSGKFAANFVDRIDVKEVQEYMGRHAKKVTTPDVELEPVAKKQEVPTPKVEPKPKVELKKPEIKPKIEPKKPTPLPDTIDEMDFDELLK